MGVRKKVVSLAVTEDEFQALRQAAYVNGKTMSTLLYDLLLPALRLSNLPVVDVKTSKLDESGNGNGALTVQNGP